jgi:ubiquinone/menaquinone biosynthesis C-methylase UbiE
MDQAQRFADVLVCNSVLHGGGQTMDKVKASLTEIHRIVKRGGKLFIGEMTGIQRGGRQELRRLYYQLATM